MKLHLMKTENDVMCENRPYTLISIRFLNGIYIRECYIFAHFLVSFNYPLTKYIRHLCLWFFGRFATSRKKKELGRLKLKNKEKKKFSGKWAKFYYSYFLLSFVMAMKWNKRRKIEFIAVIFYTLCLSRCLFSLRLFFFHIKSKCKRLNDLFNSYIERETVYKSTL